jgi:hypothetical protein
MEREAMEFAVELIHSSKAYCSMACNRLEIISHEDIDTERAPHVVPFVRVAFEQARQWYEADNPGKSRMAVGNAIRMMCRAPKSREGDHFPVSLLQLGQKPACALGAQIGQRPHPTDGKRGHSAQ